MSWWKVGAGAVGGFLLGRQLFFDADEQSRLADHDLGEAAETLEMAQDSSLSSRDREFWIRTSFKHLERATHHADKSGKVRTQKIVDHNVAALEKEGRKVLDELGLELEEE